MRLAWSVVLVASLAASAYAGTNDGDDKTPSSTPSTIDEGDRLRKLEIEIEKMKAERVRDASVPTSMSLDPQDKPKTEVDFKASFTDGFHIKSTDGNFDLHIGGRWEEEYRYTFDRRVTAPAASTRTSVNSFFAREAFISVDGTVFKNWGFKLNGDFSQQQTNAPTGAIIEEAYVEWKELKEFRILFGSFKQPVSMEVTDSPRFAELIQRSPMARFMPSFDTGVKFFGAFMDSMFTYELAVTNGRSHLQNTGRDNVDDNDGKEYAVRLTTAPFVQDKDSFLKGLRIGAYATFAHEGQAGGALTAGANLPGNIATNELGVQYMTTASFGPMTFRGDRYRVGGELTYAYGPFMFRGEVAERHDEIFTATKNNLLAIPGYYGTVSFVLTGEDRLPNARIVPRNPFSLADGGWGALELAARVGAVSLDRKTITDDGGNVAAGSGNSNRAQSYTFGFNWWPIQNVKICMDYIGENYFQDIALASNHSASHAHGMLMHFQVDF